MLFVRPSEAIRTTSVEGVEGAGLICEYSGG